MCIRDRTPQRGQGQQRGQTQQRGTRQATPGFRGTGRPVSNGSFKATLSVDDQVIASQVFTVNRDPNLPADAVADEEYELFDLQQDLKKSLKDAAKDAGLDVYQDD